MKAYRLCVNYLLLVSFSMIMSVSTASARKLDNSELPNDAIRTEHPDDRDRMSAVWVDSNKRSPEPLIAAVSTDGGTTWEPQSLAFPVNVDAIESLAAAIDLEGRTHVVLSGTGPDDDDGGIYTYSTEKDGKTFRKPLRWYVNNRNGLASDPQMVINVDPNNHGYKNHLYVCWRARSRAGQLPYSQVLVSNSVNGGYSFFYPSVRLNNYNDRNVTAPAMTIDSTGFLEVSWDEDSQGTTKKASSRFRDEQLAIIRQAILGGNPHCVMPPNR